MLRQYRFALTGWLVGVTCHAICPSWATANAPAIRLAPVVRKLLDDPATDASRRRHLAIFHGQWDQISDPTPAERARSDSASASIAVAADGTASVKIAAE